MSEFVVVRDTNQASKSEYVGYYKYDGNTLIWNITDGNDVWSKNYSYAELNTYLNEVAVANINEFMKLIRIEVKKGMKISSTSSGKVLEFKINENVIKFEILKKTDYDMKSMLFNLVDHICVEQNKNTQSNSTEDLMNTFNNVDKKRKGDKIRHKPGMSMLNPSSKKSKVPSGVVFD